MLKWFVCALLTLTTFAGIAQQSNYTVPGIRLGSISAPSTLAPGQDVVVVSPGNRVNGVQVSSTTSGIQEAYNSLAQGRDYLHPAGGKIVLQASGAPYYITQSLIFSNNYCMDIDIEGPGLMAGGIVLISATPQPVIKVTSKATAAGADAVCPMAVHIHDLFIGATNNSPTNIIEVNDFARCEIDHNWIGWWNAMTNNNAVGNAVGFSTCTFGYGVSNTALVGISIRGVSDLAEIHGNSFLGLAASLFLNSDHIRIWNNFSSFCGISNAVPAASPFSLGAAFVLQPDYSHNDYYFHGNFFYNCQAGYLLFSTNGVLSYNYNTVSSYNDSYEATPTNVLISANLRMKQIDPAFLRQSANNNSIVSTYPTFLPQPGKIESDRVQIISSRTNRFTVSGSDFVLGNGRAGITNTLPTATNAFTIYSCGIAAVNGLTYTNPVTGPDGPGLGELVYTNGASTTYLLYDPQNNIILGEGRIALFSAADVQLYSWKESVDDPLIWQAVNVGGNNQGTAPVGQLQPSFTGTKTIYYGDVSGATNLPISSLVSATNAMASGAINFDLASEVTTNIGSSSFTIGGVPTGGSQTAYNSKIVHVVSSSGTPTITVAAPWKSLGNSGALVWSVTNTVDLLFQWQAGQFTNVTGLTN